MQSTKQALRLLPSRPVRSARCSTFETPCAALLHHHHTDRRPTPTTQPCHFSASNPIQYRPFTLSHALHKKGGNKKASRSSRRNDDDTEETEETSSSSPTTPPPEDPSDFTTLDADIQKTLLRLRTELSLLRPGGRFNPSLLDTVRVLLPKTASSPSTSAPLSDLAQVIPQSARVIHILVSEAAFTKPVSSAIMSSREINMTPVPDPSGENPLLLVLNLPGATSEAAREVVRVAERAGEHARNGVREARAAQQKKIRSAEKAKSVRPDELKKVGERMEKVVERGVEEVKKIVEAAKKNLQR